MFKYNRKTFKIFAIIIFIIVIFIILLNVYINLSNLRERNNVSAVETIENMYNIKIRIISQNIDENGNGIYFIVEEIIEDEILNYDTHLIINNYEDIEICFIKYKKCNEKNFYLLYN